MDFDLVRKLSSAIKETGLASASISVQEPSLSPSAILTASEISDDFIFERVITEEEIYNVSRDLFISQFYNNSVQEAYTALDNFIKSKSNKKLSGAALMRAVFNPSNPILSLNENLTQSEMDENEGYGHLFAGAMIGIRNPVTHEHQWIDDRDTALECLIFCQHLLRKAKRAFVPENSR